MNATWYVGPAQPSDGVVMTQPRAERSLAQRKNDGTDSSVSILVMTHRESMMQQKALLMEIRPRKSFNKIFAETLLLQL